MIASVIMFITKKHLSRRTFLRGAGVAIALPLLDSMVPALTALAQTAAAPKTPLRRHLRPARRDDGQVDAGGRRHRLRRSPRSSSRSSRSRSQVNVISDLSHPQAYWRRVRPARTTRARPRRS